MPRLSSLNVMGGAMSGRLRVWRLTVLWLCLAGFMTGAAPAAQAGTILWQIQKFHPGQVDLAFYSQNRRHEWPGGGNVYYLQDYSVRKIKISCIDGERVCYGAWVRGNSNRYWGSGYKSQNRCSTCCYTCQGNIVTTVFKLNQ